jgi:hypothetical protein
MESLKLLQLFIAMLLFLVLTFGIGFILNMLLKTTWIPSYIYIALVVYFYFFYQSGKLLSGNPNYAATDYTIGFFGLIGAILSGWAIRLLREKGYRMF